MTLKLIENQELIAFGNSLVVQWLNSTAAGTGLIPAQGNKNPHTARYGQLRKKVNRLWFLLSFIHPIYCICVFFLLLLCSIGRGEQAASGPTGGCYSYMLSVCMHAQSLKSCPTLCNNMDDSLTGSSVCGIS